MQVELQKAEFWKRLAAGLLDAILLLVVGVGIFALLSSLLKMEQHAETMQKAYEKYEAKHGIVFDIEREEYDVLPPAEKEKYDLAIGELYDDEEAMYAQQMMVNVMLISVAGGVLGAMLILEFAVPLLFGNGQTLGKKAFAHCVVRVDGVKITPLQLFVRTVLGKYAVETMILIYLTIYLGAGISIWLILVLAAIESVLILVTKTNSTIHDLMAGTVVVDFNSQRIFNTTEDLVEYKKKIAAEQAERQSY